jgi:endo-1,4-beta-xylanase
MGDRKRFALGCALGGRLPESLTLEERALLTRHFASVTPENCMKPGPIHPEMTRYDFAQADALVDFAERHGLRVAGHCLVWHQQCPDWFFQDSNGGSCDREVLLERLRQHIDTVVGRYRGRITSWDVVNEAVADDAAEGDLRRTPWLELVGDDFATWAFRFAHEADPAARLVYNDYDIEQPGKRVRTLRLLRRLQRDGVRVDEVGIQGHWQLDQVPFAAVAEAISEYSSLGLRVAFSELDIDVVERPGCGANIEVQRAYAPAQDIYRSGCPEEVLERQAQQYERLFEIFVAAGAHVSRATFWGLHDGKSWLNYWPGKRTNHPLPFDRKCRPKPAWQRIERVLGS